jgi:hypothetical protein
MWHMLICCVSGGTVGNLIPTYSQLSAFKCLHVFSALSLNVLLVIGFLTVLHYFAFILFFISAFGNVR